MRWLAAARFASIALAAIGGFNATAWAQTTSWQNPATGDWFTAGNWTAATPTNATLNTFITNGGTAQITAGTADAGSATPGATLTIGGGSTLDLQAGGGLNFERMVIQTNGMFRAANDNWGGGCSNPCITLAGGTLLGASAGGAHVYWDGFTFQANTTSTVMAGAGGSLALEPGRSGQHLGVASLYTFQAGSVLQIGGFVTYSGGANVTSGGNTGLVVLTGGTLQANNPQVVNAPLAGLGLHELTSVVTTTTVQTGALLNFNGISGTINNLQGAGTVGTGAAGTVISLGQGNFSGGITGLGGITQLAGGVTTLSGTSSYTGPTTINAGGTLVVDGSIASSAVTVNGILAGGTLLTPGVVGNATINGTLSPGTGAGGLGQLNTGALQFNAGSTYAVNATATGQSDKVLASGAAAINGGTVAVQAAPGNYGQSTTYTILSAAGGRTGTFSGLTSNFAFLTPSLSYTTTDVLLTLTRATMFSGVAFTPNQASVASALDTLATGNPLFLALLGLTADDARKAFDLLSGEVHASVQGVLLQDSQYVRQLILGRLRQGGFTGQSGPFVALQNGPTVASSGYAPDERSGLGMGPARRPQAPSPGAGPSPWTMWAQGVGAWGEIKGDGNAANVDRTLGGVFGGFDGRIGHVWRVGVAGGYTRSDVDVDARSSSAEIDTGHVAAYAGARWGALNARLGSAYSWHDIDTRRVIAFPGFFDAATASYDARTGQVFGEIGYAMAVANVALEPFAGLGRVHITTDGFAETGGPAALLGAGPSLDTTYTTLGIRVGARYELANGPAVLPRASLAWQHAFGDVNPLAALAFRSGSSLFAIAGPPIARDSALVEAGVDLALGPQARLSIAYGGTLSDRVTDNSVKATASWKF